jgi:hypothetical protein
MQSSPQFVRIRLAELTLPSLNSSGSRGNANYRHTDDAGQSENLPHAHDQIL